MAAVELSAGSPDLRLGCCRRVQQSAQFLGGAGEGQEPVGGPDLRGGAGGGLAAGADEDSFPEPRCDQWCGDPHTRSQEAQGVVLPASLSGGWVWGSDEFVGRAEESGDCGEYTDGDGVGAGGPCGHGAGSCQQGAGDQGELKEGSQGEGEPQGEAECVASDHHHPLGRQGGGYDGGRGRGTNRERLSAARGAQVGGRNDTG